MHPHIDLLPTHLDDAAEISAWVADGSGRVSPVLDGVGTRVAALAHADAPVVLAARGVAADGTAGPWVSLRETFAEADLHILVGDVGAGWAGAQLRVGSDLRDVAWELTTPTFVPLTTPPPPSASLPDSVRAIGVIPREDWGARATQCTSTEDDWYRMAIHHTAGGQTSGGTVEGQMRALQAYAQDSGEYCDIPYQFMVGYDGSLWEARELRLYSGATGGGNNDGNIAVCFIGCYHPNSCPNGAGDAVTEEMMVAGQLLVQTLVGEFGITSDADTIRGHRDWPDNATACPGDWLYERLDELRAPLGPAWGATVVASGFPDPLVLAPGETYTGWFDLVNTGSSTWSAGSTNLGTLPRDTESPLYDPSWVTPTRPATISGTVPPGATGRFTFTVTAPPSGEVTATFGPVQEWVAWFADDGGPAEGALAVHVVVEEVDSGTGVTDTDRPGGTGGGGGGLPGELSEGPVGCGCASSATPGGWGLIALGALAGRRRRG